MAKLSEVLKERGYVYQFSSETLEEITDGQKCTVYLGIDPSADSLHVGNLQAMLVLRRFLEDGHKVILVIGGGTGMIGDPSGKSEERNLLDEETVRKNGEAIASQAKSLFGGLDFTLVNNADWLGKLNLIDFLRDIGKHFTVNSMIKREMVKERLDSESAISYTEFAYAILQAYDFLHLHKELGCDVQIGASDQWGNISSGIELIRKQTGDQAYGLTSPLLINKSTGKKFGKSEQGAVWLDDKKTPFFDFYQFFVNQNDNGVEELLLKLTTLGAADIAEIIKTHNQNPSARFGQKRLAWEVTALVHGQAKAKRAELVSDVLFGEDDSPQPLTSDDVHLLDGVAKIVPISKGVALADVLVSAELASSKREARQFIQDGAVRLNYKVVNEDRAIEGSDMPNGNAILKCGKRNVCVLVLE